MSTYFPFATGPMAKPGLHSMKDSELSRDRYFVDRELAFRRHLCDTYMDPRKCKYQCGAGSTLFYVDGFTFVRNMAKEALNVYNEKEQKNLNLEKVVKMNMFSGHFYLTFWARSAESEERRLFRAAVHPLKKVLLCETKDDEEITIPADHPEKDLGPISEEISLLPHDGCAGRTTDDINCGEAVGNGGVNLG